MSFMKNDSKPMPLVYKVICVFAIACCVVLGIIGLILPIIPGFLFLFLGAILLAKLSSRFATVSNGNSTVTRWRRKWRSTAGLSMPQRIKLSFWVAAKAVVSSAETTVNLFRKNR